MSDTPRTDFVSHTCEHVGWSEQYDRIKAHARLLEIELTEEHDQHRARQTECVRLVQELDEARAALREMLSMLEWKNVNYEKAMRWERAAGIDTANASLDRPAASAGTVGGVVRASGGSDAT